MAVTYLHLLVFLLVFSHLTSLNAVPITRTRSLFHETQTQALTASENTHQDIADKMDVERQDYPVPGANNRHTPKPPLVKN